MKKFLPILCAAVLLFSLAACNSSTDSEEDNTNTDQTENVLDDSNTSNDSNTDTDVNENDPATDNTEGSDTNSESTDYSNTTVTGQVTAIDGTSATLQLGELAEDDSESIPMFTAGTETATIDLTGATVTVESSEGSSEGTTSDISVGDILVIEVGDNNTATSITIRNFDNAEDSQNNEEADSDTQDPQASV